MEYCNHDPKVFILSGKAKSGKNYVADIIEQYYQDKKCIQISYAYYLKQYTKKIIGWNGSEEDKPRTFLQELGIGLIKEQIDEHLLIKRICEDIKVYSYFFDVIVITDARLIDEIIIPQKLFHGIAIRIIRDNYENGLTSKEKQHITETELDRYTHFDYIIENNSTEDEFRSEIYRILEEVK